MVEYFKIGKFITAHGLKGELLMKHELGKKTTLKGLQAIFIEERKDVFIPWFVEHVRAKSSDEVFVTLEGVATREAAIRLAQKEIWLPEADLKKYSARSSPIHLLGYTIVDGEVVVGEVLEVIEQAHQMLCRTEINKREELVPLNENTLKKIDHKNRRILVTLPEGLLAIYL